MKKLILLLVLTNLFSGVATSSTLNWTWSFDKTTLVFGEDAPYGHIYDVFITVRNDISSTDSLDLGLVGVNLSDGSFGDNGLFYDTSGELAFITNAWGHYQELLQPGEELSYSLFSFTSNIETSDEIFTINPFLHNNDCFYCNDNVTLPDEPLTVSFSAVPLPPSIFLFVSGLAVMFYRASHRRY